MSSIQLCDNFVVRKPTFETTHSLIEIRKFYTDKEGILRPGFPGVFLTEPEWTQLQQQRPAIEKAQRKKQDTTVGLGRGRKGVEVTGGEIWLHRDAANEDAWYRRCYSIRFTRQFWDELLGADVGSLFAAAALPPPAKKLKM